MYHMYEYVRNWRDKYFSYCIKNMLIILSRLKIKPYRLAHRGTQGGWQARMVPFPRRPPQKKKTHTHTLKKKFEVRHTILNWQPVTTLIKIQRRPSVTVAARGSQRGIEICDPEFSVINQSIIHSFIHSINKHALFRTFTTRLGIWVPLIPYAAKGLYYIGQGQRKTVLGLLGLKGEEGLGPQWKTV